jgi:MGT family glycosyltransferase
VTFPANEKFIVRMREIGVEAIELKFQKWCYPKKLFQYESCDDSSFWRLFGSAICPRFMMNALSIVGELEEFYAKNPPDVILYEWFNLAGRIFAKDLRRPAIQMCTHFAHHNSMVRLDGVCTTPQPMLEFSPVLDNFMSVLGFEGKGQIWHTEPLNIVLIPSEIQYDVDSFDSRFKFVGVTFSGRSNITSWKNRADGKPLVLISEGSTSTDDRFLRLCIEALAESRYRIVFLKGVHNTEISSTVLPHNFEVKRHMANREILPFADVAVCLAGMGTSLECLYHGVPVVAMPPNPFNSEVAFRIMELGLGLHVPERSMSPLVLRNAVDRASVDEAIRSRVRRMQDTLRSNRGAELAADAIEEFL